MVAASFPNLDADAYVGQLWRVDLTGTEPPRRLTRGVADASPQFSTDGSLIGFTRANADGRPQVWVMPALGGEPVQATDAKLGAGEFAFSPDGARIAYLARTADDGRYGTTEGVSAAAEDARHITTVRFQSNGLGWSNDRRRHLFVCPTPDPFAAPFVEPAGRAKAARAKLAEAEREGFPSAVAKPTQLSRGDFDHGAVTWTPDGGVLVGAARHEGRDLDLIQEVFRFDPDVPGADPVAVAAGQNAYGSAYGASGTLFVQGEDLGESGRDFVGRLGGVFVVEHGRLRRLTDAQATQLASGITPCGEGVVTTWDDRGTIRALTITADARPVSWAATASIREARELPGHPDRLVVTYSTESLPFELGILDADGSLTRLTTFSDGVPVAAAPQELTATASDGYQVHGWVYVPSGPGPHPVLLNIHGGPHATYGPAFFDEFQVYAAAGYAVVACNPRGSGGYGEHHGRIIKDDMGNLDASDIMTFLDHALASVNSLDASRVGVMGGSYGGYMTAWLIGHSDRFTAAIVERGFLDTESFIGASDIGWFFVEEYNGVDPDHRIKQSPMAYASAVRTPTLVLHSEDDLRCPLGPALRYYTTLKLNGVDAELLVFPGENHELSRSGTPHHRKQRFDAILDWWARHLPLG